MLKQRLQTAGLLLILFIITLSPNANWPFVLVLTVMSSVACWEWLKLTGCNKYKDLPHKSAIFMFFALIVIYASSFSPATILIKNILIPISVLFWLFVATGMVYKGQTHQKKNLRLLSLTGIITSVALWFSLTTFYIEQGTWFILSLLTMIWSADTVAYFVGKKHGKRKLAPKVSPGKTIEGAQGGITAAVIWMIITAFSENSFSSVLVDKFGWILMIIISIFLAALSISGDLFESLLKRRAKVKDSSNLLPGHGGVYDRIDALYPVAPLAFMLVG